MFENNMNQGINTIRNTFTNTFIKNRQSFSILFNSMFNRFSGVFCEIWISPSMKSTRKTSNKEVNSLRVIKIMIIQISNSKHRHMSHFIDDFLFRKIINIPFINFISRNKKLDLKRSFFKLHIRRGRFGILVFCKRHGFGISNKSFNFW